MTAYLLFDYHDSVYLLTDYLCLLASISNLCHKNAYLLMTGLLIFAHSLSDCFSDSVFLHVMIAF